MGRIVLSVYWWFKTLWKVVDRDRGGKRREIGNKTTHNPEFKLLCVSRSFSLLISVEAFGTDSSQESTKVITGKIMTEKIITHQIVYKKNR